MAVKLKKWQLALLIVACIALIWGVFALVPRYDSSDGGGNPFRAVDSVMLVAHRGGRGEMPENTLEAFYNAYSIDNNAVLETDVNMTADGVLILCHDTRLDRTTNVTGNVIDWTYADLVSQEVDFGYANTTVKDGEGNYVLDSEGNRTYTLSLYKTGALAPVAGITRTPLNVEYPSGITARHNSKFLVTTVEELLDAFPNSLISMEIKQSGETGLQALEELLEILEEKDALGRVVIGSFHEEIYKEELSLKKEGKDFMFSPATNGVIEFLVPSWLLLDTFYSRPVSIMQVPMSQGPIKVATRAFVKSAHKHNIAVQFWTINDVEDMRYLIEIGADGIMTDYPSLLKSVLDE